MASLSKRIRYDSSADLKESSSSEGESYEDYSNCDLKRSSQISKRGRKPKCFTKNALLAREHRLKKKMYVSKLENEVELLRNDNRKLSTVVDNQSNLITDYKKEIKYLKSVIANSGDIGRLIRNINHSSGMSVSSSAGESLSLKNVYIPKPKLPISRKTAHPWEETITKNDSYISPTDNLNLSAHDQDLLDEFDAEFFGNINFMNDYSQELFSTDLDKFDNTESSPNDDHNYTSKLSDNEDVGVCLHVSRQHVSLEFCSACSEKAHQSRPR